MAETTIVDIQALATKTTELLQFAREDFETSLERVQDVIDEIDWLDMRRSERNTLISEVGKITFDSYKSVKDLLEEVVYSVVPTQELLETDMQKSKKHVFISDSLDTAESKIVDVLTVAGSGEMKALSGVMLSDAMREALRSGQGLADGRTYNDGLALLRRYQTPDQAGNESWYTEQHARGIEDRDRNVYSVLFSMAQENIKWCYQQGVGIEQLHENFTARYNRLFFDITSANIAVYKAEVQASIAEFEGRLRQIDAEMSVEELKFERDSTEWKLKIDQANGRMNEYVKEYAKSLDVNRVLLGTRIAGGKNVADGYKSIYSAYSSQYSGVSLSNSTE